MVNKIIFILRGKLTKGERAWDIKEIEIFKIDYY